MFGLPEGERVEFELVSTKPWSGSTTTRQGCVRGSR